MAPNMQDWFVPGILPLCLASCVYLFEQLEEERGDKRVAEFLFVTSCVAIALIAFRRIRETDAFDAKAALTLEIVCTALVSSRVVQRAESDS